MLSFSQSFNYKLLLLLKDSYKLPSMAGYCRISSDGKRPEHCKSKVDDMNECRIKCDVDSKCIAFSFRYEERQCYRYTRSSCNKTNEIKGARNQWTSATNLMDRKDHKESGCFVKLEGKCNNP